MAATKVKDLAVKTGEYEVNGERRGRWENIGAAFKTDDGGSFLLLKRTFNPAGVPDLTGRGGDSIMISLFDLPDDNGQRPAQNQRPPQGQQRPPQNRQTQTRMPEPVDDFDEDIPF